MLNEDFKFKTRKKGQSLNQASIMERGRESRPAQPLGELNRRFSPPKKNPYKSRPPNYKKENTQSPLRQGYIKLD